MDIDQKQAAAVILLVFLTVFLISYFQEYPIFPSLAPIWRILVDSILVTGIIIGLTILGNRILYELT